MKKNLIFAIALLMLFASTTVSYAMSSNTTSTSISASGIGDAACAVKTLSDVDEDVKLRYSQGTAAPYSNVAPLWKPVVGETGAISPGDLYYLKSSNFSGNILVKIYLTNTAALIKNYTYLNLKINVWTRTADSWVQAKLADGSKFEPLYLSLTGADISFVLPGNAQYCISIDGGNYYCIDTDAAGGSLSPEYFIDTQPS
jgi:hypothetical protein